MEIDGLYQLEDVQLFPTGEQMLNVYFFTSFDAAATAEDLTLAFNNDVLNLIKICQAAAVSHTTITARNLGDPADYYERALTGAVGGYAGESLSAFTAYPFTLRAATRAVRPGSKRIGGVPEAANLSTNGVITDATLLTALNNVRTAMATVVNAAGPDYQPVIVKRVRSGAPGSYTYRLPTTDAEAEYYDVATALLNTTLSHQVSRGNNR